MLLKHASTPYLNIKFHSNFGSKQFNLSLLIQYHHLIHHSSSDNQMKLRCFSAFQWRATSASIWSISLRLLLIIHSKMLLEVPQIRCWYFHFGETQRHKRGRKTRKNRSSSQQFDYGQVHFTPPRYLHGFLESNRRNFIDVACFLLNTLKGLSCYQYRRTNKYIVQQWLWRLFLGVYWYCKSSIQASCLPVFRFS